MSLQETKLVNVDWFSEMPRRDFILSYKMIDRFLPFGVTFLETDRYKYFVKLWKKIFPRPDFTTTPNPTLVPLLQEHFEKNNKEL